MTIIVLIVSLSTLILSNYVNRRSLRVCSTSGERKLSLDYLNIFLQDEFSFEMNVIIFPLDFFDDHVERNLFF